MKTPRAQMRMIFIPLVILCCAAIFLSCGKKEQAPAAQATPQTVIPDSNQIDSSAVKASPEVTSPQGTVTKEQVLPEYQPKKEEKKRDNVQVNM